MTTLDARALAPGDPVTALAGVGPARARAFAAVGVRTLGELAAWVPRGLDEVADRLSLADAARARGSAVCVRGTLTRLSWVRLRRRGQSALRATLDDGASKLDALFVNQPWLKSRLALGQELVVHGKIGGSRAPLLVAPRIGEPAGAAGELRPRYRDVPGVSQAALADLVGRAFAAVRAGLREELPSAVLERLDVPPLPEALAACHAPTTRAAFDRARRRFALDVLIGLQARIVARRARRGTDAAGTAPLVRCDATTIERALAALPYAPTSAQRRAIAAIARDIGHATPMRRLLQGDVGSGKTAVGLVAAMLARSARSQSAFLAPTELLAEQQYAAAGAVAERAGLRTALLVGSLGAPQRRAVLAALAGGEIDLVFGTHALFQDDVRFAGLALAVIDEQHRFGVAQRRRLLEKGRAVHALLMTATPIPRTLALTLYGDLEVTVLDEKPPGRAAVTTRVVPRSKRAALVGWLGERLAAGERAFWVLPRVERNEDGDGAEEVFRAFADGALAAQGVELVHGRQEPARRQAALARFRRGDARLLVGTTVLEVGVDVPEATVMVVEGAERFGLAQLHQLRGRVGRGSAAAHCYLLTDRPSAARLGVLATCDDGFRIAEADLAQRGMGDLVGLRQAGANAEGLEGFEDDLELWTAARDLVAKDAAVRERALGAVQPPP